MVLVNYLIVCFIFGTTFLAIKVGIEAAAPPFLSAGVRFFAAGLALFLFMLGRKKTSLKLIVRKEMPIIGATMTFGTFAALYWAEQHVTSGIAAVLSATGPMLIIVLQWLFLGGKASLRSAAGCMIGFAGVILLLLPGMTLSSGGMWLAAGIAIIAGEVAYAGGTLYSKTMFAKYPDESPIALNAVQMMYGGLFLMALSALTEDVADGLARLMEPGAAFSVLYLTVVGSMVGHSLYYWLVARTNPVFPSTWLYVSPIIALMAGALFYDEQVAWISVIGGLTIIGGTVAANFDSIKLLWNKGETSKKPKKLEGRSVFGMKTK